MDTKPDELIKNSLQRLTNDLSLISERDSEILRAFCIQRLLKKNVKIGTIKNILKAFNFLARCGMRDVEDLTEERADMIQYNTRNKIGSYTLGIYTYYFYLLLKSLKLDSISKDYIKDLKNSADNYKREGKKNAKIKAENLLTKEDIAKLMQFSNNERDRAYFAICYAGLRIGEILDLRWNDIKMKQDADGTRYYQIVVKAAKTEFSRTVTMIEYTNYIERWQSVYPDFIDNDYIFINLKNPQNKQPIQTQTMQAKVRRIAERAGIEKRVYSHLFRHTAVTDLSKKGMNESFIKINYWGHTDTSVYNEVYLHLTDKDSENAILEAHGMTPETNREDEDRSIICPSCHRRIPATEKYCWCGEILDPKMRDEIEIIKNFAQNQPEYTELSLKQIQQEIESLKQNNKPKTNEIEELKQEIEELKKQLDKQAK